MNNRENISYLRNMPEEEFFFFREFAVQFAETDEPEIVLECMLNMIDIKLKFETADEELQIKS